MQGMLASSMNKPQAAPQGQPAMQGQPAPEDGQQAAPGGGDALQRAMDVVQKALYGAEAARDVAKAMKSASDPAEGLAMTAYEMVAIADEATNGEIPDEDLIGFASEVLGEVADIANAAGVPVGGAQIAKAVQLMLVRFVTEQGIDPSQLQQAMAAVPPEQVGAMLEQGA